MPTIIFDIDDTLYDQLQPFQLAVEKNFGFQKWPIEQLFNYSRQYSDAVFDQVAKGTMSSMDMQIFRIKKAFEQFGQQITAEQGSAFQVDYQRYQQQIKLLPDIKASLDLCLKHKVQLGVITNGPAKHQARKVALLNLTHWIPEKNIFISGKLGYAKPAVQIFQHAERVMDLEKETTYYVGDSFANDIVGAQHAGWKTIWMHYRNQIKTVETIQPDYTIEKPGSLPKLLSFLIGASN